MKNIKNKFFSPGLLNKIFNKPNLNKILIIFIVGFTSRIFINYIYNVNVFIDYFNKISIIYYVLMSMFTVLIHEVTTHFNINIIPTCVFDCGYFITNLISSMVSHIAIVCNTVKNLIYINGKTIKNFSFKDFSIPSIKKLIKNNTLFNDSNKISLNATQEKVLENCYDKNVSNTLNPNTLSRSSNGGNSNKSNSTSSSSSNNGSHNANNRGDNRRNGEHRVSRRNRDNVVSESRRDSNQGSISNQSNEQQDNPANNTTRENRNEL
jgi:hypothetical protein